MKRWLWIGSLALGASSLVACNQSGGGDEGVGSTQRVIVRQLDTQSATVFWEVGEPRPLRAYTEDRFR
jgi:hypothetical protein